MRDRIIRRLQQVRLTRESLIKMALGILAGFFLLSVLFSLVVGITKPVVERAEELNRKKGRYAAEELLVRSLQKNPENRSAWIQLCQHRSGVRTRRAIEANQAIDEILDGLRGDGVPVPNQNMKPRNDAPFLSEAEFDALAQTSPFPREILDAWLAEEDLERAIAALAPIAETTEARLTAAALYHIHWKVHRELAEYEKILEQDPTNRPAHNGRLIRWISLGETDAIERAIEDPEVRPFLDHELVYRHYKDQKDFVRAYLPMIFYMYQKLSLGLWVSCLAVGLCWMVMIFHLGLGTTWRRPIQWLVLPALVLGWFSADFTLGAVLVVDDWLGDEAGKGINWHILHALLIGVREEFFKLLLFLPLVPYLLRAASETQALVLASVVGLGFAVHENSIYYGEGHAIIGRFLTANFLHMALTGYAGYFLFRALRQKTRAEWIQAVEALAKVMVVHGAYDFFIIAPQLSDWSFLHMIIFILIAQQYLRLIFHIRPHRAQRVSSTRIFVATLATVTGMHYLYLSTQVGIGSAIWDTIGGLLGVAIITFMYFQEFDERVA